MDFSSLGIADNKLLLWAVAAVAVLIVIYSSKNQKSGAQIK